MEIISGPKVATVFESYPKAVKAHPEHIAVYFKCTSKLVPTFKSLYKDKFNFEGNRAIVFQLKDKIPVKELKHCIALALTYHKIKHLPLLGT
mgnify:CR=1 FL=1